MRSPSPRVTYSYSDPAPRTSLAYLDTIQPIAKTPIPAISTDSGEATPPPLPVTLATPTTSGITKADVNTGPINPTDCAITSGNDNTLAPRRPVSGWGFSMSSTILFLSSLSEGPYRTRASPPGRTVAELSDLSHDVRAEGKKRLDFAGVFQR